MNRGGITAALIVILAIGGFAAVLIGNSETQQTVRVSIPTNVIADAPTRPWQDILSLGVQGASTLQPTVVLPGQSFVAPTLQAQVGPTDAPVGAGQAVSASVIDQPLSGVTATPAEPGTLDATFAPISTRVAQTPRPVATNPPSLPVPLARDPRDHYWLLRPIDADRTNRGLNYYEYGTDGPTEDPYPIHHGMDMPNEIGTTVRAAGAGVVVFAASEDTPIFQNSPSYGNVVVIEHDFTYRGQTVWTLYAHLEAPLVITGQRVAAHEAIALLGNTGQSGGPHVHVEVRLGENTYGTSYNPGLWLAPFVNHGTVAGKVIDERGNFMDDVPVTLLLGSVPQDVTTSYVFRGSGSQVNPDPLWGENFLFTDVPVGRYDVVINLEGRRVVRSVTVREGLTSFVELSAPAPVVEPSATP
jgi:murein DD-endopeptidase MepM/ murein hydrolase activator NlpD